MRFPQTFIDDLRRQADIVRVIQDCARIDLREGSMTEQQFLEEIKQLSIAERIALIEAISRSLREELDTTGGNASISAVEDSEAHSRNERERKMAAVKRLRGIIKFEGDPPTDEEVKNAYADHLIEKYS
jgi:hypothetical protein